MNRPSVAAALVFAAVSACGANWPGFEHGIGIGGWLTNYKRFNVLPENLRLELNAGDYEHFDTYITEADVERIRRWGFDHVRLGFDQIVLEEAPGKYRERTFRKIDEFIGWCGKHRLNVVLNLHKAVGNYCDIKEDVQLLDNAGLQRRMIDLWIEMERRYHGFPGLAFEILNEVRDVDPEKWNDLAGRAIRAIREKNRDRWIVIGPTCWNNPPALPKLRVWDDPKVVYTFHMYAPHLFTHQRGVLQSWPLRWNREARYPDETCDRVSNRPDPRPFDRAYLAECLKPAFDWAAAHPDKILWNGEFGTIRHAPPQSRVSYMNDVVSLCREHGIPWCVWNYLSTPNDGNRFSLVDDVTRDFLSDALLDACLGRGDVAAKETLKFMTYNIWGNPMCERDLKIAAVIEEQSPDVVAIQEADTDAYVSRLFRKLGGEYGIIRDGRDDRRELNPILYRRTRLELVEGGVEVFAKEDNPQGTKGYAWGVFRDRATGRRFIAYSTHLWWQTGTGETLVKNDAMRVRNVMEVLLKVEKLRGKYGDLPVVGGGDLNARVNWREREGRLTPLETLERFGFADAQYVTPGASPWSSAHGEPRRDRRGNFRAFFKPGSDDPKNSLDHVHFTPQTIEPLECFVDRSPNALESSDHSPVTLTFRFK